MTERSLLRRLIMQSYSDSTKRQRILRNMDERTGQKLSQISARARKDRESKFNNLAHHISPELIELVIKEIPKSSSAGPDGLSRDETLANLDWMLKRRLYQIHKGHYEAEPVRRVNIPKADGGMRPLGVPSIIERGIQGATALVLEQIYEQAFKASSFGFRPERSCHNALATLSHSIVTEGMNFALEVDIRNFFGSLDHGWLLRFLAHRISDPRILDLIRSWLKAGILEGGKYQEAGESGSPQGGSISPILANVYLHYVLDLWFEHVMKRQLRGKARLIRYADDFVIMFERTEDLVLVEKLLKIRLKEFGLEVAEEKTHRTDLRLREREDNDRRHISFLGFEIFKQKTRNGTASRVTFKTQSKRLSRSKQKLKDTMKEIMHWDPQEQCKRINLTLKGHYQYYGFPGNSASLARFHYLTTKMWKQFLVRRSQNSKMNWDKYSALLKQNRLLSPKLHVRYADLAKYVRL
jgi:RNA-directed DNA polymerase